MVAALLFAVAPEPAPGGPLLFMRLAPATALLFTGATALLLIADLHRPERFHYILLKPNPRSWLVAGTWILILYSIIAASWLAGGRGLTGPSHVPIIAAAATAGACSAGYSGFLFAQAKGRDLWQSPLFMWHLLVQAIVAGSATMILLAVLAGYPAIADATDGGRNIVKASNLLLLIGLVVSVLIVLGELVITPFSADADYAADMILRGRLRNMFWLGVVVIGTVIPAGLVSYELATGAVSVVREGFAAVMSLAGLLVFERIWIIAGQAAPLS
jgi:formate-dependent nitrite reductase membrane component NrfD